MRKDLYDTAKAGPFREASRTGVHRKHNQVSSVSGIREETLAQNTQSYSPKSLETESIFLYFKKKQNWCASDAAQPSYPIYLFSPKTIDIPNINLLKAVPQAKPPSRMSVLRPLLLRGTRRPPTYITFTRFARRSLSTRLSYEFEPKAPINSDIPKTAVVLHGIMGSHKNLRSISQRLAASYPNFQLLLVTLR